VVSGAAAFVFVWEKLPKFRYLAALSKLPGMPYAMEFGYVNFLKVRPQLQAFFVKKIDSSFNICALFQAVARAAAGGCLR